MCISLDILYGLPTSSEGLFLNIVWPLKKERTLSKRTTSSMRSTMLGNPSSDEVGKSYRHPVGNASQPQNVGIYNPSSLSVASGKAREILPSCLLQIRPPCSCKIS